MESNRIHDWRKSCQSLEIKVKALVAERDALKAKYEKLEKDCNKAITDLCRTNQELFWDGVDLQKERDALLEIVKEMLPVYKYFKPQTKELINRALTVIGEK
jgi:hypothetical protein